LRPGGGERCGRAATRARGGAETAGGRVSQSRLQQSAPVLSVIVPAYNERPFIERILDRVLAEPTDKQVIVVDDGSTDGTAEAVQRAFGGAVTLLRHERNRGKGAAIRTALPHVRGRFVVVQDADLEYDPADYAALLEPLLAGRADVVYGSRNLRGNPRVNSLFYWGGRLVTLVANLLYGARLTDEATGYKCFRADVLRQLRLVSRGFGFCPEVTAKLLRRGVRIVEVPIRYNPRPFSEGKKIRARHGLYAVMILVWYRFFDWP